MATARRRKEESMKHRRWCLFGRAVIYHAGLAVAAFAPTKVTLQLKWVTQAQFAGYYCAQAKGYYRDEGLDVVIKPGGPQITPAREVASGKADFGVSWMSSLLAMRERGVDLVNIAQVMRRSGMTEITWKDSGITSIAQLRGKKNQETARRFLEASFKGWIYCRDHLKEAVEIVLQNDPTLGRAHQTWQ